MAKWMFEDHDEYGRHYRCSSCGSGLVVKSGFGKWTPKKCGLCGAKMEGVDRGKGY